MKELGNTCFYSFNMFLEIKKKKNLSIGNTNNPIKIIKPLLGLEILIVIIILQRNKTSGYVKCDDRIVYDSQFGSHNYFDNQIEMKYIKSAFDQ